MTRVLIGIFAHPDDEAFGPAGTLLKFRHDGYDIHLLLLTDGEAGTNPDGSANLGSDRLKEWRAAGAVLGAASLTALHHPDGGLDAVSSAVIDAQLDAELSAILSDYEEEVELRVMTFEPDGLTGHRDHIAASQAADRLYARLAEREDVKATGLWQFCLDERQAPLEGTAYYQPRAREASFITHRVDVSTYLSQKHAMIDCHASQAADAAALKKLGDELLATECFHVID